MENETRAQHKVTCALVYLEQSNERFQAFYLPSPLAGTFD